MSHAHPEPKRVAAAASKASLNASKEPYASVIAFATAPVGSPPPLGLKMVQNSLWL